MQSHDDRIEMIRKSVAKLNDDHTLDLNNVSFAEISDKDNDDLTLAYAECIKID